MTLGVGNMLALDTCFSLGLRHRHVGVPEGLFHLVHVVGYPVDPDRVRVP